MLGDRTGPLPALEGSSDIERSSACADHLEDVVGFVNDAGERCGDQGKSRVCAVPALRAETATRFVSNPRLMSSNYRPSVSPHALPCATLGTTVRHRP